MTPARRHLIYLYLLYKGLNLLESHARQIAKAWYGISDFGARDYSTLWFDGVRSVPDTVYSRVVLAEIKKKFDLEGIAGLYFEGGLWRLNVDPSRGSILKPYRDDARQILGLLVYRHLNDRKPRLLTSRDLPMGTPAESYEPERIYA